MKSEVTDATLASLGGKTMLAGAGTGAAGVMFSSALIGWVGVGIAFVGLLVNLSITIYFAVKKHRFDREENTRRQEEHDLQMQILRSRIDSKHE